MFEVSVEKLFIYYKKKIVSIFTFFVMFFGTRMSSNEFCESSLRMWDIGPQCHLLLLTVNVWQILETYNKMYYF